MNIVPPNPLSGPPPTEIPLAHAPLVRVIAQVRFPTILKIRKPDSVADFQETIRSVYPILEKEQVKKVTVQDTGGAPSVEEEVIWRFHDKERNWRVSLGTGFIALEAFRYDSRKDFLTRLKAVLVGIETSLQPQEAIRIGIRYIDRIDNDNVNRIDELIKEQVLGIAGTELGRAAQHVLTETVFPTEERGSLRARWGRLPANATIDPTTIEPINGPSWILDLDMYTSESHPFATDDLVQLAKQYSERIYTVFRWMVREEFIKTYGGSHE